MLILGDKYKFTDFEKDTLKKKKIEIHILKYTQEEKETVLENIKKFVSKNPVSLILLNAKVEMDADIIKYLTSLQLKDSTKIMTIESFMESYLHKCYIPDDYSDLNYLNNIKPFNTWQYIQKRIIDYIGVFLLLLPTCLILLYTKYRIKKESPGSCIFKQLRVGQKRKEFKCIKFRSMRSDSYHDPYTRENDTRIFPWGNIMRKTRIDELPQIFNVLKGEMHIIGPRAEWNILVRKYENQIPYYNARHLVKPGITGWAQVNYPYGANIEDAKQKLMYDLYYIKHWNFILEINVVLKTIMVIFGRKGI